MIGKSIIKISTLGILFLLNAGVVIASADLTPKNRTPNRIIHQHVVLPCAAHRAFQMFTIDEYVESWLTVVADIEPVAGGKYECFWDPEDRENNSTIGCKVTAVTEDKLIAFEWRGPIQFKPFMNNADPLTHVVVIFIPIGTETNPETDVQLIHSGWRGTEEWEEARLFFVRAWRQALEKLVTVVRELNG